MWLRIHYKYFKLIINWKLIKLIYFKYVFSVNYSGEDCYFRFYTPLVCRKRGKLPKRAIFGKTFGPASAFKSLRPYFSCCHPKSVEQPLFERKRRTLRIRLGSSLDVMWCDVWRMYDDVRHLQIRFYYKGTISQLTSIPFMRHRCFSCKLSKDLKIWIIFKYKKWYIRWLNPFIL